MNDSIDQYAAKAAQEFICAGRAREAADRARHRANALVYNDLVRSLQTRETAEDRAEAPQEAERVD